MEHATVHSLRTRQELPLPIDEVFAFFADAHRAPARVQFDAFGDALLDLVVTGRHFAALLEADNIDLLRALPYRCQRHIDGDVAAPDYDHAFLPAQAACLLVRDA